MWSLLFDSRMSRVSNIVCCLTLGIFSAFFAALAVAAPNITILSTQLSMGESVVIAGARLPWATQFFLNANQAVSQRNNRCGFAFAYELVNSGNQSLPVKSTSISAAHRPLHLGQSFTLRVGDKKSVSGTIYLMNGLSNLLFSVESAQGITEKTVAVQVSGC